MFSELLLLLLCGSNQIVPQCDKVANNNSKHLQHVSCMFHFTFLAIFLGHIPGNLSLSLTSPSLWLPHSFSLSPLSSLSLFLSPTFFSCLWPQATLASTFAIDLRLLLTMTKLLFRHLPRPGDLPSAPFYLSTWPSLNFPPSLVCELYAICAL